MINPLLEQNYREHSKEIEKLKEKTEKILESKSAERHYSHLVNVIHYLEKAKGAMDVFIQEIRR